MTPGLILTVILGYFLLLMLISWLTSRGATNDSFFLGNKKSPWYLVAFGMIGASLSGVTFISVPGWVNSTEFSYMQVVLGYLVGYMVIAFILMPIYYRMNLTSIYGYLEDRFGKYSYKTGAGFFLLSRIAGASIRLLLIAEVLQAFVFEPLGGFPFWLTVLISILFIWLYTFKGGIKTIVWTDTLQTTFMLTAVILTIYLVMQQLGLDWSGLVATITESDYSQMFFFEDINAKHHFFKDFIAGAFIAIGMTGLDQDMMQKNLSCKNIGDAQKNMVTFSVVLVFVNFLFLALGVLLYKYAATHPDLATAAGDALYPTIAIEGGLNIVVGLTFVLGLVAAAYSSADSALTALTTSVCVDFLNIKNKEAKKQEKMRRITHIGMSAVLFLAILIIHATLELNAIGKVLLFGALTYGPLIGLYAFGIFTRYGVKDRFVPVIAIIAPVISYFLYIYGEQLFGGYQFNFEILGINGLLVFLGLLFFRKPKASKA